MGEGSGGVGWRGPHTETDGCSWAATGSRQRRWRAVFPDLPHPQLGCLLPTATSAHQEGVLGATHPLSGTYLPLSLEGVSTRSDYPARIVSTEEGQERHSERKLDATTRRGLERGWSRTEA